MRGVGFLLLYGRCEGVKVAAAKGWPGKFLSMECL